MNDRPLDAAEQSLAVLMDLDSTGPAPALDDLAARRWADAVLERAEGVPAEASPPGAESPPSTTAPRRWLAAGMLVAASALVAWWAWPREAPEPDHADTVARATAPDAPNTAATEPATTRLRVPPGQPLEVEVGPGARLLVGGGSEASLVRGPEAPPALTLHGGSMHGELALDPAAAPFVVHTPEGRVEVLVAVFDMEVAGAHTMLTVHSGHADIIEHHRQRRVLAAGQSARLGADPADDTDPTIDAAPQPPTAAPPHGPDSRATMTAEALMTRAATHRRHKRWAAAAADYAAVVRRHPDAGDACIARVSEAGLRLDHLHQAKRALGGYDRYLERCRGALVQEARYGRARALRALGATRRERAALQEFLRHHSSSLHGASAQLRLADLHRQSGACNEATALYEEVRSTAAGHRLTAAAERGLARCDGGGDPSNPPLGAD